MTFDLGKAIPNSALIYTRVSTSEQGESGLGLDAQVGMALYRGLLDPAEAFLACLDWDKQGGLIPAAPA